MTLIDKLPKNEEGQIILSPGGSINGKPVDGVVEPTWFSENFPEIANAEVPLGDKEYQALRGIGDFWRQNAERWRAEGLI